MENPFSDLQETLSTEDIEILTTIHKQMHIVADVSRAEMILYGPLIHGKTTVLAHARPHSVAPAYLKKFTGLQIGHKEMPVVIKALKKGRKKRGYQGVFANGASVYIEVCPVHAMNDSFTVIGAISIDTTLVEYERQRRRDKVFRKAISQIQDMLLYRLLHNAENITRFREYDGLMIIDKHGVIRYVSGVAGSLYRKLGYMDSLVSRNLDTLMTYDHQIAFEAMNTLQCVEQETEDGGKQWIRKALPIVAESDIKKYLPSFLIKTREHYMVGALMIIRDITRQRRNEQEIRVKNTMVQEIHHRVKNNLQTIAALLRIQSRRLEDETGRSALEDAASRILSVAVIHEFLSDTHGQTINIKDIINSIIQQLQHGIISADQQIVFQVDGPPIWLPARQATECALVINELLQNALEHGIGTNKSGIISINFIDRGNNIEVMIHDNGRGLPMNFDSSFSGSLGLQIVRTLVTEDLRGELVLLDEDGATAIIIFSKTIFKGEEGWNENESS